MVLSWNIKQVVKKKYPSNPQDQKDWEQFIKHPVNLYNKDNILDEEKKVILKTKKIDLHGLKLNEANELIRKFITNAYEKGYKKLLVVILSIEPKVLKSYSLKPELFFFIYRNFIFY